MINCDAVETMTDAGEAYEFEGPLSFWSDTAEEFRKQKLCGMVTFTTLRQVAGERGKVYIEFCIA